MKRFCLAVLATLLVSGCIARPFLKNFIDPITEENRQPCYLTKENGRISVHFPITSGPLENDIERIYSLYITNGEIDTLHGLIDFDKLYSYGLDTTGITKDTEGIFLPQLIRPYLIEPETSNPRRQI